MRVLMVVRPARGGMRRHLLTLVPGLMDAGLEVEAAGPAREPLLGELSALGCPVHDLPLSASLRPGEDLVAAVRLAALLRQRRYDLVHVHGFKASLPGRLAAAAAGRPVVYTVHNFVFEASGGWRRRAYLACERVLAPFTSRYIAVSEALRQDLAARVRLPAGRIAMIYGGVPPHAPTPPEVLAGLRRELRLPEDTRVILCAARLVPEKGVDLLLQALAALRQAAQAGDALPPVHLLVAGDGPEETSLRALAEQLQLTGQVAFLGHRQDVPALLDLADAVVLPSRAEGLSLFLLEALVAGRPVVAAAAGGMTEVVSDGENGLLAPVGDPLALAAALRRLLTDRALVQRLGQAARESGARFTVDEMVRQTLAVYRECAQRAFQR